MFLNVQIIEPPYNALHAYTQIALPVNSGQPHCVNYKGSIVSAKSVLYFIKIIFETYFKRLANNKILIILGAFILNALWALGAMLIFDKKNHLDEAENGFIIKPYYPDYFRNLLTIFFLSYLGSFLITHSFLILISIATLFSIITLTLVIRRVTVSYYLTNNGIWIYKHWSKKTKVVEFNDIINVKRIVWMWGEDRRNVYRIRYFDKLTNKNKKVIINTLLVGREVEFQEYFEQNGVIYIKD